MITTKIAKPTLINHTPQPVETMCWARRVMHAPVPNDLVQLHLQPKYWLDGKTVNEYFEEILLHDGMPTFLEYVNTVWKLENVSRALTHQLVRHRIGFSFSQQSMRCVKVETFAEDGNYYLPETVENKPAYAESMLAIQDEYNRALKRGVSTQDARGLLPTNIQTTITFSANLRALFGMLNKRMCLKTQGEFRDLAQLMKKEIIEKIDPRLEKFIGPPCQIHGKCMMEAENEEQWKKGLLEGNQNTDHVCPLYVKLFKGDKNGL